ncbi:MAG: alkaline shock response membrane anchor protein AmaP [Sulfobacillus sp.]
MKAISIIDRVILVLYTITLGLVSVAMILMGFGWLNPLRFLDRLTLAVSGRLTVAVIGAILLLISVRLASVAFAGGWRRRHIVHQLPMGRVRVSMPAVEGLVKRLVKAHGGVHEAHVAVRMGSKGLLVAVRTTVGPEVEIATLSDELQQAIRSQVNQVVGVGVERVSIDVDHITPAARTPRETS